ncbi:MAG: metallophosphoesterase [Candidatus Hydrogenedentes bacterium]|nr:metallophosphoesterase [Candidatus Hydrogenedentota bacterium]
MIRLVHTADVHLDRCYSQARFPSAFGNRRRQSIRDAFLRIVRRAGEWPADALLIAGDLFEHDRVSRDTVAMLQSAFDTIPHVPVYIAPGNHDPFVADSPYARDRWPENVFLFTKPVWSAFTLARVPLTVHGFGFDGPDISVNPFGALAIPGDGRVHVAVAHGSEMGSLPPGKGAHAPFDVNAGVPEGLHYLALGHYHGAKRVPTRNGAWVQYAGSPEGHDFGEPGVHVHVEIEIDGPEIRVREMPSAATVFETHSIDCSNLESSQSLVEAIRALPASFSGSRIARLVLTGSAPQDIHAELPALYDSVQGLFDHLELTNQLELAEDFNALAHEQTSLGAFIAEINSQLRDITDPRRLRLLERAREVGLAAYRGRMLPIQGVMGE